MRRRAENGKSWSENAQYTPPRKWGDHNLLVVPFHVQRSSQHDRDAFPVVQAQYQELAVALSVWLAPLMMEPSATVGCRHFQSCPLLP